jgi:hypothetical protein
MQAMLPALQNVIASKLIIGEWMPYTSHCTRAPSSKVVVVARKMVVVVALVMLVVVLQCCRCLS